MSWDRKGLPSESTPPMNTTPSLTSLVFAFPFLPLTPFRALRLNGSPVPSARTYATSIPPLASSFGPSSESFTNDVSSVRILSTMCRMVSPDISKWCALVNSSAAFLFGPPSAACATSSTRAGV